jgi:hypothetical protein
VKTGIDRICVFLEKYAQIFGIFHCLSDLRHLEICKTLLQKMKLSGRTYPAAHVSFRKELQP